MKRWKRLTMTGVAVAAVAISGFAMTALADSREEQELQALKAAFIGSEETTLDMSRVDDFDSIVEKTGTTAELTEQQMDTCVADYAARVEQFFSDSNRVKQQYQQWHETYVRDVLREEPMYLVDGGVLDCTLRDVQISEDGNTATFHAHWVTWNKWAEQAEDGSYRVTAPIGDNDANVTMVKEDGLWKLLKISDLAVGDANDAMNNIENTSVKADEAECVASAYDNAQKICQTSYDSFAEALSAAKSIDINEINPYPLLERDQ